MFSQFSALVVEGNPLSRSVLVRMLLELGFKTVAQATRPKDALAKLELQTYDFIFCEFHFADSPYTGQVFVDDLRHNKLLPLTTAFVMVTSEASHARVAEAAESALDSYILKPFNYNDLRVRLLEVRSRKDAFKYVYAELALNEFETAAELCEGMIKEQSRHWVHAARIAAELRLQSGEHERATQLFALVSQTTAVPWSKLGLARVDLEAGNPSKATRALEVLLTENPLYADAYDVMGRAMLAQGDLAKATEMYTRAVAVTPSSVTRLQKLGALAFLQSAATQAEAVLDKAFRLGAGSKMYDYQSLVFLTFLRYDSKKDPKFMHTAWSVLRKQLAVSPDSFRLQTMLEVLAVLAALQGKKLAHAVEGLAALAQRISEPQFDFEMACNFLGLLKRMGGTEVQLAAEPEWVELLARRFCSTRLATDFLSKCLDANSEHLTVLELTLTGVNHSVQAALTTGMQGNCAQAVTSLLEHGKVSHNSRILEVASLVAEKYRERLTDYPSLSSEISDLRHRYCSSGTQVGLPAVKGARKGKKAVAQFS